MRGSDTVAGSLFSYVGLEERVWADHSLRVIHEMVNSVLVICEGGCRKIGGQAAIAIGGYGLLAGWDRCLKPEQSVPL